VIKLTETLILAMDSIKSIEKGLKKESYLEFRRITSSKSM
jgi:hypothetical protein